LSEIYLQWEYNSVPPHRNIVGEVQPLVTNPQL